VDDESVVAPELQTESCAHDHARQWSEAEVVDRRRTVILDVFGSVNARSGALDHAIRLLLLAAQTARRYRVGDRSDRARAARPVLDVME
jgi:hypothetical protein